MRETIFKMPTDDTNIMQLRPMGPLRKDRTVAERSKRFRQRQKERKQTATRDATPLRTVAPAAVTSVRTVTPPAWAELENTNDFKVSDRVRNGSLTACVEPFVRMEVTMTTVQMSALAGRLSDGCVTRDDLDLAARLVMAFAGQYPRDGVVRLVDGDISDDLADDVEAAP
jgi:hypothetical protein